MTKNNETIFDQQHCLAIFDTHIQAEEAVKQLQKSGYDMNKLSIIGKDYRNEEHVIGYYNTGDRIKFWGGTGAFWGSIWGILFSSAFMMVPGFGHLLIAGPFVSTLIGAIEGASLVGGLSALGAALYGIGIPKNSIVKYETAIKANKFLLMVHGTDAETLKASYILEASGGEDIHQSPNASAETVN